MSSIPVATGAALQPGQIQFYEAIQPPLVSGIYRLTAGLDINLTNEAPHYDHQQPFAIAGPRFRLQPDDVQQVYPPANLTGNYQESLPHAVLRQRTLPWSRTIDGSVPPANTVPCPWLAVLNFSAAEMPGAPNQISVQELLAPTTPAGVIAPQIPLSEFSADDLAQQLLAVDIAQPLFLAIAPTLNELPFLAHARQVNTDGKEILGLDEDGYFSVVIGNRLPLAGSGNTAMLVSLEGHQSHLPVYAAPAPGDPSKSVRVVVLASWSYTASPATGDFLDILQALPTRGGIDLLRMPHAPFPTAVTPQQTAAQEAIDLGYVPLDNNTRSGELTTSWYRGPGAPVVLNNDPIGPYLYSDGAIRYDPGPDDGSQPGTGMFDMSYACAWQIGRLLALSDAAFARALFEWRRTEYTQQNVTQMSATVHERVPSFAALLATPAPGASKTQYLDHLHQSVFHFWRESGSALNNIPTVVRHEDRADAALPGVVTPGAVTAATGEPLFDLFTHVFGGDLTPDDLNAAGAKK